LSLKIFFYVGNLAYISSIITNINNQMEKYTVYMTCPAFPGKVRKSVVESNNLWNAKKLALSLYPGYILL